MGIGRSPPPGGGAPPTTPTSISTSTITTTTTTTSSTSNIFAPLTTTFATSTTTSVLPISSIQSITSEITLRKSDSNERLGVTVCYSNGDDYGDGGLGGSMIGGMHNEETVAEVYISDIHPDSVAGRDGRLRQGDQILQINGKDIKTRSETETLIAENNNAVTLLVSRYLYADEDDFNDPSTNEDDDEVLEVEDDDDDDEDDDEIYDENNLTYVNCCINVTDELDKALMSQVELQQEHLLQTSEMLKTTTSTVLTNSACQNINRCSGDGQKEKEKVQKNETKTWSNPTPTKGGNNVKPIASQKDAALNSGDKSRDEYESEHIYETIPEDPESEPFYCSPYDSSVYVTAIASCSSSSVTDALHQLQQKQRVAKWLGIKPTQDNCNTTTPRQSSRNSIGCGRSIGYRHKSTNGTIESAITTLTNATVDCTVSSMALPVHSQTDDQDNSSSAYNTGGSNNSVSPLTLLLNPKNRTDHTSACSTYNITPNSTSEDVLGIQQLNQKTSAQPKNFSPKDKCYLTSPKLAIIDMQTQPNPYSNKESNIHRNMLLRQHLFNQTLSLDKIQQHPFQQKQQTYCQQQQPDQIHCPQFTAPNLSQYHFVSSQEVNNLSLYNKVPKSSTAVAAAVISNNTKNEEEAMVWKVKRRPDGTRYIVRRPVKNRIIKERNTRLNVERIRNDIPTTEDDTISEIKTGRYWTREERKRHIEKAKEKRQQQQHYLQQGKSSITYDDTAAATLCISDVVNNKIIHDQRQREKLKCQEQLNFLRQKHKAAPPSSHQQHYQLQFNSVDGQKLSSSLKLLNVESPTIKPLSTMPITSDEVSAITGTTTNTFTSSEHNQINNAMLSVTTA